MKFWFLTPFAAFALAGCSNPPPLQTFPTLDYSYLPPIVLKVASLNVVNNYVPTPSQATLIGQDPAPPATVLLTMLNHRIIASGAPGTGTVTIANASIDQIGGNLTGTITVDINVSSPDGHSTGYAEATVSASRTAPATDASRNDMQAALYGLTKQLMTNMNVQLQYQIQHNLGSWLSWTGAPGTAAPAAGATPGGLSGIQATPLTAPA
ncbi:MAG TPA: hypothetical protein VMV54_02120, partial [Acidocella sp.]|nr:hypothetical protein [Acidocella sp.]